MIPLHTIGPLNVRPESWTQPTTVWVWGRRRGGEIVPIPRTRTIVSRRSCYGTPLKKAGPHQRGRKTAMERTAAQPNATKRFFHERAEYGCRSGSLKPLMQRCPSFPLARYHCQFSMIKKGTTRLGCNSTSHVKLQSENRHSVLPPRRV